MSVDSTGRYIVASNVDDSGTHRVGIWAFAPDGVPDPTFGTSGLSIVPTGTVDTAYGVAVDVSDDSIYVLANADTAGTPYLAVFKLDSSGALDATFGTGGILNVGSAAGGSQQIVNRGIFVESTGNVVYSWNPGAANSGQLDRISPTGVAIDSVSWNHAARGVEFGGSDGFYVAALLDTGTGFLYAADANITTTTINETSLGSAVILGPVGSGSTQRYGVSRDASGNVYITGRVFGGSGGLRVGKLDNTLTLDAGFGTGGYQSITDGSWVTAEGSGGGIPADSDANLIVSGFFDDGVDHNLVTAKIDAATGALIGAYGTAGVQQYSVPAASTDAQANASIVEDADGRSVHVGWYSLAGVSNTLIVRTLNADGALDLSFG